MMAEGRARAAGRHLLPLAILALPVLFPATPAFAQAVVQAIPGPEADRLAEAMRVLAQQPEDLAALLQAGDAALYLGDLAAAQSFYARARDVAPQDGRVAAGHAVLLVRQDRPADALAAFDAAEAVGTDLTAYAADRGLAYDLVGNNAAAQVEYDRALSLGPDDRVTLRLAISQAIAGDRTGFEATLLPLLQQGDLSAFRMRAFALAINGQQDEAVSIAQTMLPERLSSRLAPYLRYMPRLTRAQQAAAAHLGRFPQAHQIGQDDPAIAALARQAPARAVTPPQVATVDARLVPGGAAMGSTPAPAPAQPVQQQAVEPVAVPVVQPLPEPVPQQLPPVFAAVSQELAPVSHSAPASAPVPAPLPTPASQPVVVAVLEQPGQLAAGPVATVPDYVPAYPPPPAYVPPTGYVPTEGSVPPSEYVPAPAIVASAELAPVQDAPASETVTADAPAPEFAEAPPVAPAPEFAEAPAPAPAPQVAETQVPLDMAGAFATFVQPAAMPDPVAAGGVDITTIAPPRERPKPPPAPPAPPAPPPVPSRHWVQLATGRDSAALGFDWRRIRRAAGELLQSAKPHLADWDGRTRLLAGPYTSAEAEALVASLKEAGVDSFQFTSARGEDVRALD